MIIHSKIQTWREDKFQGSHRPSLAVNDYQAARLICSPSALPLSSDTYNRTHLLIPCAKCC